MKNLKIHATFLGKNFTNNFCPCRVCAKFHICGGGSVGRVGGGDINTNTDIYVYLECTQEFSFMCSYNNFLHLL